MAKEIERKFLVNNNDWSKFTQELKTIPCVEITQGYLFNDKRALVRVRIIHPQKAFLCLKVRVSALSKDEFEYEIPMEDARLLLEKLAGTKLISKKRYTIAWADLIWEVDEFLGDNLGLIVAEVELEAEEQNINLASYPSWIAKEVTGDNKYYNVNLMLNPFTKW